MADYSLNQAEFSKILLDTVGALITVLDLEGRVVSFNRACEQLSGYSFEEVRGKPYTMFLLPEELPAVAGVFAQLTQESGVVRYQNYWVTRSGEKRWIDWSNTMILSESGQVRYVLGTGIDLTEQKLKEQAVQESERWFALLFDANPAACSIHALDGTILEVNANFEKLMGQPRGELIGKRSETIRINFLPESYIQKNLDSLSAGVLVQKEVQLINLAGQDLSLIASLACVKRGGQACLISTLQDISERKRYEQKLLQVNEALENRVQERVAALAKEYGEREILQKKLNHLLRVSPVVILSLQPYLPYRTTYASENIETVLKLPITEVLAQPDYLWRRMHPDDLTEATAAVQKVMSGQDVTLTLRLLDGTGRWCWVHAQLNHIHDTEGQLVDIFCSMQDISQQRAYEDALRESEERYRSLAEAAHDFIYVISPDGKVEYVNSYGARAFGIQPEEMVGQSVGGFFPKERWFHQREVLEKVINQGKALYDETLTPFPDGARWLGTQLAPLRDASGRVKSVLGVSRDITEQKKAQEELQRALSAEKELNDLRANFVAMVTHQMGTPLTTILSSAELLKHYASHWAEEKRELHLQRIIESTQRVDRMLRDTLELGRMSALLEASKPALVNVSQLCQGLLDMFQTSDGFQHDLVLLGPSQPVWSWVDQDLLTPMLESLLSNALKYSPTRSRVELGLAVAEGWLRLWVRDEGLGIPAEDRPRLGQTFYRGKNVLRIPGSGLGLSMVKQTLDALGGSWEIDSVENAGTTIQIQIPFRSAPQQGVELPL